MCEGTGPRGTSDGISMKSLPPPPPGPSGAASCCICRAQADSFFSIATSVRMCGSCGHTAREPCWMKCAMSACDGCANAFHAAAQGMCGAMVTSPE